MAAILYGLYTEHGVWNLDEVYEHIMQSELNGGHLISFMAACMEVKSENIEKARNQRSRPKPYRKNSKKNRKKRKR